MNNQATPHCADEGTETKVLAHVRGLKSVLSQLSSSTQPRSDHQRRSSDHPMCSPSRRRAQVCWVSVPVSWIEPWAEPLPGQPGCCSQCLKIADRDGTLTFPAATSTTLAAILLVPRQTWCCVHGQHVIISYMQVCSANQIKQLDQSYI